MLLLIGINLDIVSYGVDIQTPFMFIGILMAVVIVTILFFLVKDYNSGFKIAISIITFVSMIFLGFYYILEDHFTISF